MKEWNRITESIDKKIKTFLKDYLNYGTVDNVISDFEIKENKEDSGVFYELYYKGKAISEYNLNEKEIAIFYKSYPDIANLLEKMAKKEGVVLLK